MVNGFNVVNVVNGFNEVNVVNVGLPQPMDLSVGQPLNPRVYPWNLGNAPYSHLRFLQYRISPATDMKAGFAAS